MKFIQLFLGLNSSISTYACPWCKVSKDKRAVFVHPYDYYNSTDIFRTVNEIEKLVSSSTKEKFGVVHYPQLKIEPDHYISDELHMMMRITDVLIRSLIDACSKDNYSKLTGGHTDSMKLIIYLRYDNQYSVKNILQ